MSRHSRDGDPEFGSDSFLDIIANIVGILIILIVVAGVKVAKQPAKLAQEEAAHQLEVAAMREKQRVSEEQYLAVIEERAPLEDEAHEMDRESHQLSTLVTRLSAERSRLSDESAQLETTLANNNDAHASADATLENISEKAAQLNAQTLALRKVVSDADSEHELLTNSLQNVLLRQKEAEQKLRDTAIQRAALEELILEEEQASKPELERLEHRLSPVARTTSEQELHFRMSGGRIAWVPLEPLLDRLKSQVQSRASVVRRFGKYEGLCGPVGGFVMNYTVTRVAPSPLDALNGVQHGFRIEVSRWTVKPSETFVAESVDDALKSGSRFRNILEATDPDATITIWLYAEDFARFHELRELAHKLDLRVAARPLPAGTDISGSPGGSRTSAQ